MTWESWDESFPQVIPRPAGPLDFPPPAGGGGRLNAPPWSRLLVAVEKNERHHSKAREKSFRNHFGHFLAQVKIEVSRGQSSKIYQNGFSTIKSLILTVEQRFWYHRVCLVKARRTIYKMTLKGQGQILTSGQVRPRSRDDRNGSYCISVDSPGRDECADTNPTSLSLFDQKLLANDGWWLIAHWFFAHWLMYNGEVAKMTWPEVTDIKNPRYTFCRHYWPHHIQKVS